MCCTQQFLFQLKHNCGLLAKTHFNKNLYIVHEKKQGTVCEKNPQPLLQITAENITQSKQSSRTKRRPKLMTVCIFIAASLRKGKDYSYNKFCCFH